ncbi:MAG: serine hydrolase [Ignavibacteriae bacterium HGW-Ignavibacteriae-4]|jgi:CubicO group peptidase (beta-lactamase class C family)|nr:MAG: serine hydrolase [Ignavibacteriae bacterium HGW-Ignavibacteriae-4]
MKTLILFLLAITTASAGDYYFPPIDSDDWVATPISELGWSPPKVDVLIDFLDTTNTKGFIILVEGKIVIEEYFGDHDKDKFWYWASAGKTLTSAMIGLAQQEGKLDINDPTSDYLGNGWTNMEIEKERNIKLLHNLSMSTGIDYNVDDSDCLLPECLDYLNEPGTHWYYHNAPYRLLLDVLDSAYSKRINQVTNQLIGNKIGMGGAWIDYVRWGKTRDLARFGLFIAAGGKWGDDFQLDPKYYNAMINTSQEMNKSYGYLWWLNGKDKYKLPGFDIVFNGPLVPTAPMDMFAALGKNDQKIYVIPSMNMVVVRVGEDAGDNNFAASSYDSKLWEKLSDIFTTSGIEYKPEIPLISPNPANEQIVINTSKAFDYIKIYDLQGNLVKESEFTHILNISDLASGKYNLVLEKESKKIDDESFVVVK